MSSSTTNYVGAKILCIVIVISLMGTRSIVNGGVVINGASLSSSRPSSLLTAASNLYMAQKEGHITHAQGYQQGQYLIQANKDKVNLALIKPIGR